ncbi:efflux RND transporter periplasmic adaptor subunit [Pseudoalteromonas sp. T1lg65]|uniref:efflux RND transporter periplasmic adaptor subunit n=1 Tax=Pseudoalteromonas sp. T1lg65 TaxID=2077101 RepID=UPI003F7AF6B8
MFRNRLLISSVAIICLLLMVAWLAGVFSSTLAPGEKSVSAPYNGETYIVRPVSVKISESVPASVVAKENTMVSSRILAELKTLTVRAGDTVKAGQLIATLDAAELRAELQRVDAQRKANDAKLVQAQKQLQRSQALNEKGLVAINQVDEWQARVDELTAQARALDEALRSAEVAIGYTQVKAPISGKVVERLKEPGSTMSPGMPIVSLVNPLQLQVEAAIREGQIKHISIGSELMVRIPSLNVTQQAVVTEMVPVADQLARSFIIKLDMHFHSDVIPGMYAVVEIPMATQAQIEIPENLVKRHGQLTMVEVVETGQLVRRYIRLGEVRGNRVQVLSGLQADEVLAMK